MVWKILVSFTLGYLLGSYLPAYSVAKRHNKDINRIGDGNPGATNVYNNFGIGWGLFVLLWDLFKGVVAIILVTKIFNTSTIDVNNILIISAGVGALVGHLFPAYQKFMGGEGIATATGLLIWGLGISIYLDHRSMRLIWPALIVLVVLIFIKNKSKYYFTIFVPLSIWVTSQAMDIGSNLIYLTTAYMTLAGIWFYWKKEKGV